MSRGATQIYKDLDQADAPAVSPNQTDNFHQFPVVRDDIIPHLVCGHTLANFLEKLPRARDLDGLDLAQFERRHGPLGFGHEVDVLDAADLERDRPVRVVVADRGRDQEPTRELCVDHDLIAGIELLHEPPLDIRVRDNVVVDMVFQFRSDLGEVLT